MSQQLQCIPKSCKVEQHWSVASVANNYCIYRDGRKIYDQNNKSNKLHITYIFHNKIFWLTLWYQVIILSFIIDTDLVWCLDFLTRFISIQTICYKNFSLCWFLIWTRSFVRIINWLKKFFSMSLAFLIIYWFDWGVWLEDFTRSHSGAVQSIQRSRIGKAGGYGGRKSS